jgi:hypothetical protein
MRAEAWLGRFSDAAKACFAWLSSLRIEGDAPCVRSWPCRTGSRRAASGVRRETTEEVAKVGWVVSSRREATRLLARELGALGGCDEPDVATSSWSETKRTAIRLRSSFACGSSSAGGRKRVASRPSTARRARRRRAVDERSEASC